MFRNEQGFTLIEFLVSIVILMVGLLGLLQAVNVAIQHNMNTQLRNEATMLADERLSREMGKTFDLVSTTTSMVNTQRVVLKGFKNFSVARSGVDLTNSKQVNLTISWKHRGMRYVHETSTVISKRNQ